MMTTFRQVSSTNSLNKLYVNAGTALVQYNFREQYSFYADCEYDKPYILCLYGFIYSERSELLRVSQACIDLPMCITRGSQRAGEHVHAFTLKMPFNSIQFNFIIHTL